MCSTLGSPATSPVRASSEPSSPVSTGPLDLEPATDRPVSDYQYNGATHCGECRRPKKYDHIDWRRGLVDGYTCQCSKSPSPPDNTPNDPPTPQLARRTIPFPEEDKEDDVFSSINYKESDKENETPIPPPGFIHNDPNHPFFYPIYLPCGTGRATRIAPYIRYSPDYTLVEGSLGLGSETRTTLVYLTKKAGHPFNMTSSKWANLARDSPKEFAINMALEEINDPQLKGEVNRFRGKREVAKIGRAHV